jgi:NDP-sugar pyrophosphorylase family protein
MRVSYAHEDPVKLLGTGGALVNALPQLREEFLVMYGDSYLPTDYAKLVAWFHEKKLRALMSVYRNEGKWDKSNVRVEGSLVVYYSKSAQAGEADHIDYGLSAFRRSVIEAYQAAERPLDLARIQMDLVARREMGAYVVRERFYEIGKPEGLAELNNYLGNR